MRLESVLGRTSIPFSKNTRWATRVILNFLDAKFKKKLKVGETNFNNIFNLTQYIHTIILTYNQCKNYQWGILQYFLYEDFKIRCISYTYKTSQFSRTLHAQYPHVTHSWCIGQHQSITSSPFFPLDTYFFKETRSFLAL